MFAAASTAIPTTPCGVRVCALNASKSKKPKLI
jgi:hypothetical protein